MADGTISGATGYLLQPGPHTPAGLAQATITNEVTDSATGSITSSQPKWLTWEYMTNFKWSVYRSSYLNEPTTLYRAGNSEQSFGLYWSTDAPMSESLIRENKVISRQWKDAP